MRKSWWVSHLPADLLPLLARFTEDPDAVFGPYVREVGWEAVPVPEGTPDGAELTDLLLECNVALGRLQGALIRARQPDSPGGEAITVSEGQILLGRLDELIHRLADLRAQLSAARFPSDD